MPSKATWRIYYTFYFVVWWRKNWENVDAKKMLKYSLLLKHYLLLNETWMTDFSWQTCLACQVLNVGYEKCKMLLLCCEWDFQIIIRFTINSIISLILFLYCITKSSLNINNADVFYQLFQIKFICSEWSIITDSSMS